MLLARQRRNRHFALAALGTACLIAAFGAWIGFRFGGIVVTEWIDDVGEAVFAFLAGAVCGVAAWRHRGRARLAWSLVGMMSLSWAVGEAVWSYYEVGLGRQVPFPSFADLGYLAAVPFAVAGMLVFTARASAGMSRLATALDGSIIAGSLLLLSWAIVLGPVYQAGSESLVSLVIALAYPISDVVILTMVLLLVGRAAPSDRWPLFLLGAGLAANLLADSAFTYLTAQNGYGPAQLIDTGWVAGYLLIGLAAFRAVQESGARPGAAGAAEAGASWLRLFLLPYSPLAAGVAATCAKNLITGSIDPFLFWDLMVVALLVIVRQFIVLADNLSLTRTLRRQTAALAEREEHLRSLLEHSSDVATLIDREGLIQFQSTSVERIFAYAPGELIGHPLLDLVHPADRPALLDGLNQAMKASAHPTSFDIRLRHKLGSWSPCQVTMTNLMYLPSVESLVVNIRDIADRKELEEKVAHQASHDPVTNLPNRAAFRDHLNRAFTTAGPVRQGVGLLFLDLDHFAAVNTRFGNEVGDQLLAAVGARLQQLVRPDDLVARWTNDEFVIFLQGLPADEVAVRVAARIFDQFKAPFTVGRDAIRVRVSIGGARAVPGQMTSDQLVTNADLALQVAKAKGGAHCEWYAPGMTLTPEATDAA